MIIKRQQTALRIVALLVVTWLTSSCSNSGSSNDDGTASTIEPQNDSEMLGTNNDDTDIAQSESPVANDDSAQNETNEQSDQPASVLTTENANAVINQAFEVFTGRAYDKRLTAYPYVKQAPSLTPANNALGYHFYYETLACENNGEKSETIYEDGTGFDGFTFYDTTYANCRIGGDVLSGRAVLSGDTCCDHGYQKEFSNEYSVTFDGGGAMSVSGIYRNDYLVSVENFDHELNYSGGSLSVMDATTNKSELSLTGSFRMLPPILENQPVAVTVTQAFENDEELASNLTYTKGIMQIQAADSEIIVDANNGDDSTVSVTISANGESTTRTEPWSNWFHALSFVPTKLGQALDTPMPNGDGTVLNQASYRSILTEVFNVITGERLGKAMLTLPGYPFPEFPYTELRDINGYADETIQTCDNSGTASLRPFRWGTREVTTGWRSEFNNCSVASNTLNGGISTRYYSASDYFSPGLTLSNDAATRTFKGTLHYKPRASRSDGSFPPYQYRLDSIYFDSTDTNDAFVLSEADFIYRVQGKLPTENTNSAVSYSVMRGNFALSSRATNQNTIKVHIPDALYFEHPQRAENVTMASSDKGVLHIDAGNGNELYLHANTDDEDTFSVFIYQPGEEPVGITERWQDWQYLLGFNFDLTQ